MKPEIAFDEYHQAVYSFAYHLTRREDIAEDITQECFLALVRAPDRFDEVRGTLKTILIARNLALKAYRDHRLESQSEDEPTVETDPRARLELSSAVANAVSMLPLLQQESLILFEYEGATLEEIATVVGTDIGTVKSRLHRARSNLRRILAPYRKAGSTRGTV